MRLLKTTLPEHITSLAEAKAYLTELHKNGEHYHPDDPAADCFPDLHEQDAHHMDFLMDDVFKFFEESGEDVYFFILRLDPDYKMED